MDKYLMAIKMLEEKRKIGIVNDTEFILMLYEIREIAQMDDTLIEREIGFIDDYIFYFNRVYRGVNK